MYVCVHMHTSFSVCNDLSKFKILPMGNYGYVKILF